MESLNSNSQERELHPLQQMQEKQRKVACTATESERHVSSSRSRKDTHAEDADINSMNDKQPMAECNGCILYDNHDLCVLNFINDVNARAKSKSVKKSSKRKVWKPTGKVFTKIGYTWRPTGRTFTIVGNACPLTRITTTTEVPFRKPTDLEIDTSKPEVTLVYSRKPRKSKTNVPVSKPKIIKSISANNKEPSKSWRSIVSDVPSSSIDECRNDHVAKIMGYADYQMGNVRILRVYYVEGLGHNLFFVRQFCDSNLEVAFHQHTCFICNLEGVDLLTGSQGNNLYTLSLGDMMASSPTCLLSKASKTKSWLWYQRLSHLNFGAINHLDRHGLVRGLLKLKFKKDHLCSACAMGKSKKKPHKPKSKDTNQEKLYLLHMDLYGPMRVASVNGKKYILVIVDDYSRFTWVKCLRSKDEALDFIIKFLKMIQLRLKAPVRRIRTDNGTEFVNQTLREYYEKVGISHETSVARSPQQNGVVERRNHTLIEAAHTMLIYAKAPLFLWAEAVATACYTQNHSIIRLRHGKTPYELLHDKLPDLSFFHVFGALCYPTNDSENLGKLQPKADIDFDELTAMASEHSSLELALHEMTPATISSGLVPNTPPSTSYVPPSRTDLDTLFQPLFDELLNPPPSIDPPAPEVIAPNAAVVATAPAELIGSPSSTTVDQDAPSPNVVHMNNDPFFGIPIPENDSESSSSDVIPTVVHTAAPNSEHALTQSCWIEAMQKKLNEFERLKVWELVPRLDKISQSPRGIFLNQSKYALESLKKYGMESSDPVDTPMVEKSKLDEDPQGKVVDPTHYRGMVGTLMYLTASRPDLTFVVCMCARYQAKPTEKHLHAVKRIFKYLRGTVNRGLWYPKDSSIALTAYADIDHAGCQHTRRSTSGSMQLLGDKLVSWSTKRQKSAVISSTEAKYISLSGYCAQVLWMRSQLTDYGLGFNKISMYCDNKSTISLCCNNLADIFTKSNGRAKIEFLINKLGMRSFTPETLKQLANEAEE
ncbi:retrovirus-related pol polyprotein from transposon TNT 1-94 [Tanacetum coccineum]|uniref:Retrovirus-related pol polyprotein from transposon TNT 1-94 n=1 Tax=Tanacetum coccineum TaxID=301880 RepID=A0ABQ5ALX9_9ASTR